MKIMENYFDRAICIVNFDCQLLFDVMLTTTTIEYYPITDI